MSGCTINGSAGPSGFLMPVTSRPCRRSLGVDDRILVGGAGLCQSLHADTQARLIHHGEHRAHAPVPLTKQIACGAVVIHDAGCIAMNPHFPLNRPAGHSVALAKAAFGGDNKFRHNEQ